LREEIKDLKSNLLINKEIIEGFVNYGTNKDKNNFYVTKLKEEYEEMRVQIEKIVFEKDELRQKVRINNLALNFRTNLERNDSSRKR
jgi:predicted nuclease with TOPRIM domain